MTVNSELVQKIAEDLTSKWHTMAISYWLEMCGLPTTTIFLAGHLQVTDSKRTRGNIGMIDLSCDLVFFPVSGGDYTSVCGSIRAYQYSGTDAFEAYHDGRATITEGV